MCDLWRTNMQWREQTPTALLPYPLPLPSLAPFPSRGAFSSLGEGCPLLSSGHPSSGRCLLARRLWLGVRFAVTDTNDDMLGGDRDLTGMAPLGPDGKPLPPKTEETDCGLSVIERLVNSTQELVGWLCVVSGQSRKQERKMRL
uniref:Uncharacterized protein n=1 Tax=Chromera velia CCMP2878 TaxID=1169474 RepID=A0A0G4GCC3_9ALVE|eukprot:Cvel_21153.t1-p1 / transcript=Cvel_21153.t1 / gene=Cvel_21153 / organism=Chromera_velia_CCMP2878 / gene_product=hypothetical protein / transcript_product=hypothetical protein / location=Cvel_scaffold1961:22158-28230(+) / protein_length=143 / sequence_SO=supercontig / SO=protein_coding / is_pseudo=false